MTNFPAEIGAEFVTGIATLSPILSYFVGSGHSYDGGRWKIHPFVSENHTERAEQQIA